MAGNNNQDNRKDNPVTALEALGNVARSYAGLAPTLAPPSSSVLVNPAAAFAAVAAAAAKQLAMQGQATATGNPATSNPPSVSAAPPPPALASPFCLHPTSQRHPHPASANINPHQPQQNHRTVPAAPNPSQAVALVTASALVPNSRNVAAMQGNVAAMQGNAAALSAILQSVGQQAHNLAAAANVAAPPPAAPTAPAPAPSPPPSIGTNAMPNQGTLTPAATQVVPAHAAGKPTSSAATMPASALLPNIHSWSLEQLENHVKLLQQMKQLVPQSVALLLADARRKEEKKTAKRVANRKSACTSRARKKALVEEMTRTNARLRRQALILSLLPDLVIVISPSGEISFCSAQVERVLRHKIVDLIGANIRDVLMPASQIALGKLISELTSSSGKGCGVGSSQSNGARNGRATHQDRDEQNIVCKGEIKPRDDENGNVSGASSGSCGVSSAAAVVSDQSFPLSVVKVNSKQEPASDENENSDTSGGKGPVISSLSSSTAMSLSASFANSACGPEDGARSSASARQKEGVTKVERLSPSSSKRQRHSSSDDSSSGSTETKKIRKANENLERNVRWHNKKLQSMSKSAKAELGHKDDVLGDSVTPNNALARLSSLQHYPGTSNSSKKRKEFHSIGDRSSSEDSLLVGIEEKKKNANNENASDDSGYRESNDSREETSSSASESSNSNGRSKPLAPTCNVCLIRDDFTTLWCEVTSSIRTKGAEDETLDESLSVNGSNGAKSTKGSAARQTTGSKASKAGISTSGKAPMQQRAPETKELLLCLRPIRDGDETVDEALRFLPHNRSPRGNCSSNPLSSTSPIPNAVGATERAACAASNGTPGGGNSGPKLFPAAGYDITVSDRKRLLKKQHLPLQSHLAQDHLSPPNSKKSKGSTSSSETEKTVVESLMLMSHKSG